ncbi:MAG: iron export ABC transporter permease subunit FetB [Leptolyngbyaceae cyanobacterium MO_188.B28]|nr:iron export ABC transporter permease subunit FetB [Leptolyngbyaceae cyanobacterium MO_188.B28]
MIELELLDLLWALGLMAAAMGLSSWRGLGLTWNLAIATGRTVLQLFAVGYFLAVVFEWRNPWAVLAVLMIMLTIAAVVARNRISKKMVRLLPMVWGCLLTSTALTLAYTNLLVIRPETWYEPRYVIPLAGIVLGNAMNAASIAGERLVGSLQNSRLEIETHLSLGATPDQAIQKYRREAVKAGLIPTLNAMMVVGVVTLPGIITGQLMSGVSPLNAAGYQMIIMFMLAFSTLLTAILVTWAICRQAFNQAAQLIL